MAKENWPGWEIFVRDGCVCMYCGLDGKNSALAWHQLLIDHLIPRSKRGPGTPKNKVVACWNGNAIKRGWDKTYSAASFTRKAKTDLVASAKEFIQEYHRRLDPDYPEMMNEVWDRLAIAPHPD